MRFTMFRKICLFTLLSSSVSLGLNAQEKAQVGVFGGGSFITRGEFQSTTPDPNTLVRYKFANGGVFGFRVRETLSDRFGLEQSFTVLGTNNVTSPGFSFGSRLRQVYFNANVYGNPADARIRPYFSGGIGAGFFVPTTEGKQQVAPITIGSSNKFQFNLGAGVLLKASERIGFDLSVRNFFNGTPAFGYPDATTTGHLNKYNFQPQAGLMFLLGATTPPIVHTFNVGPAIEAGNTSLCPGESTTLKVRASDSIPENKLTYRWTIKGQEVSTSGPEYAFTAPGEAGPYEVGVTVFYDTAGLTKKQLKAVKNNPGVAANRTLALTVKPYRPPQASASADRGSVLKGERVRLTGKGEGSECSTKLSYRWTVDKGQLLGSTSQVDAELETGNLTFDESLPSKQEQKILATFEVTDEKGAKASATQEVVVSYQPPPVKEPPKAIQVADINFAKNSARVNNCAKRLLANELYPQITGSGYRDHDVLLIGHMDAKEAKMVAKTRKAKKASSLDRERALNAAAFLGGRGATCKDIELSRIKVSWMGTEQASEFKSSFCDTSTRERKRDAISNKDDSAKNRRVEIWLVPKGAQLPAGAGSVQDAPQDEVSKKGCPK